MKTIYTIPFPSTTPAGVVALSDYDGMLPVHHALLAQAKDTAVQAGQPLVAGVLWGGARGSQKSSVITPLDARLELIEATGLCETALVLTTLPEKTIASPAEIMEALTAYLETHSVIVGGLASAWGGADEMAAGLTELGLMAGSMELDTVERRISHGDALRALEAGNVREVAQLLGRPYSVNGVVVPGDRRGRLLGFPTANLRLDARLALPANGIYAVLVALPGQARAEVPAVVSLGVRPQFGEGNPRLFEVFILDAALDLYGLPLRVQMVERLRAEMKFDSVEALIAQMNHDVASTRQVLAKWEDFGLQ